MGKTGEIELDAVQQTSVEAAVFRRLLAHLDQHKEVQNIELMILADFCRNCLSKWYVDAAASEGVAVPYEAARTRVYGMPYSQWKENHQPPASAEQQRAFEQKRAQREEQKRAQRESPSQAGD